MIYIITFKRGYNLTGVTNRKIYIEEIVISFMTFNHLENRISKEYIPPYLELFDHLQEPTKTVLRYTLDIASYLNSLNLKDEYEVFGGYAVLSHLMNEYSPQISKVWRGSEDIDMAGTEKVRSAIKSGYDIHSDRPSPNIRNKRTLKLCMNSEIECKIDFSTGNYEKKYGCSEENYHFGVPLKVIGPKDIIKGKLYAPIEEEKHLGDILGMLSVLEKRGCPPQEISSIFIGEGRKSFYKRLEHSLNIFERDRFGFFPSKGFLDELKEDLSKKVL